MTRKPKARRTVRVLVLKHGEGLPLPSYQTEGSAGLDLLAAIADGAVVTLAPGRRSVVPTGLCLELPQGTEAQVRPRSGLAMKHGVTVLNSPGTIDSDYRGEVQVILVNLGEAPFVIRRGDRIAQLVVAPVTRADLDTVTSLAASRRGQGGFGSTGVAAGEGAKRSGPKRKPIPRGSKSRESRPGRRQKADR